MTKYTEFSISIKPDEIDQFAQEANNIAIDKHNALEEQYNKKERPTNEEVFDEAKFTSLSESLNLLQQHKIYSDQTVRENIALQAEKLDRQGSVENIYGKASKYDPLHDDSILKIGENYKNLSEFDAGDRLPDITLEMQGQEPITVKVPSEYRNNWDKASNYLEDKYHVKISDEQRNFLRSQVNQSGTIGCVTSIVNPNLPVDDQKVIPKPTLELQFNDKKKLNKISYIQNMIKETDNGKETAYSTTTEIDVSNLISDSDSKRISDPENKEYIPQYSAKEIKMSFKGNDTVAVDVPPEMDELFKKHAKLEGKEVSKSVEPNIFTRIKNYISAVYNDLKSTFSYIKESIKNSLTRKQTQDTPKVEQTQDTPKIEQTQEVTKINENKSRGRIPPKDAEKNFNNTISNSRFNSAKTNSNQRSSDEMTR